MQWQGRTHVHDLHKVWSCCCVRGQVAVVQGVGAQGAPQRYVSHCQDGRHGSANDKAAQHSQGQASAGKGSHSEQD